MSGCIKNSGVIMRYGSSAGADESILTNLVDDMSSFPSEAKRDFELMRQLDKETHVRKNNKLSLSILRDTCCMFEMLDSFAPPTATDTTTTDYNRRWSRN